MSAEPLLVIDRLAITVTTATGPKPLVRDVSLSVAAGEAVALVGESGAGKSMTGRAIARLLPANAATSGTILFDGRPVLGLSGAALRRYRVEDIGVVFQDPRASINPVRRIGDFLTESLIANKNMRARGAREQVGELLRAVGIRDPQRRLSQYPHELSGGLLQRIMIASVLAMRPKLIIADEPTTSLDVTTQAGVMALLRDLQTEFGIALLLVTHDLDLAAAVCDRTAVMYAGTLLEVGPSHALHDDPRHPYSAALITSRPPLDDEPASRLRVITGSPLSASEAPSSCVFSTRCSHVRQECLDHIVALEPTETGYARCCRKNELHGRTWPLLPAGAVDG